MRDSLPTASCDVRKTSAWGEEEEMEGEDEGKIGTLVYMAAG